MPTLEHAGITINYTVQGEGEPLLLIMGLGGSLAAWRYQVPELSQHFQVIAFDNRGAGGTSAPHATEHYSMVLFAADAIAVLDAVGVQRAHVYGVSMGGMIAQHVALNYPDRVRGLVLGCTTPGGQTGVLANAEVLELLLAGTQKSPEEAVRDSVKFNFSADFPRTHPDIVEEYVQEGLQNRAPLHGFAGQWAAILGHDTGARLGDIRLPTLVQHGTADVLVPYQNASILAERIPNARLQPIAGAGHVYFIEQPQTTNDGVREFLHNL